MMRIVVLIDDHLVRVLRDQKRGVTANNVLATLYWGDDVPSVAPHGSGSRVELGRGRVGFTRTPVRTRRKGLLRAAFIDVGQGDACLLESPSGRTVLVDGGETQRLARYLAMRYSDKTTAGGVVSFDAVVVTHGDADHFDGLTTLATQAAAELRVNKQIHFTTERVFHNGLVKRPVKLRGRARPARAMFGAVESRGGRVIATELVDEIGAVPASEMNASFSAWAKAIEAMRSRGPLTVKRISRGDDAEFAFFDPDVKIEVLGPTTVQLPRGRRGLPFLHAPGQSTISASHTINGHSIVLRVVYGRVRLLLAADLNEEAERALLDEARSGKRDLTSEILKVPHHGSGDFATEFLAAVRPVVSVVSAGDEDELHEYIHPRANLMGALGRASRTEQPLVFVTDLAAFDRYAGPAVPAKRLADGSYAPKPGGKWFYARERVAHGIVHVRTDGRRVLVATSSGRRDRVEAYLFSVTPSGRVRLLEPNRV